MDRHRRSQLIGPAMRKHGLSGSPPQLCELKELKVDFCGRSGRTNTRLRKLQLARSSNFGHQEHTFTTSWIIMICCSPFHPMFVKCWFFAQSMSKILKDPWGLGWSCYPQRLEDAQWACCNKVTAGAKCCESSDVMTRSRAAEATEGANSKYLKP